MAFNCFSEIAMMKSSKYDTLYARIIITHTWNEQPNQLSHKLLPFSSKWIIKYSNEHAKWIRYIYYYNNFRWSGPSNLNQCKAEVNKVVKCLFLFNNHARWFKCCFLEYDMRTSDFSHMAQHRSRRILHEFESHKNMNI